MIAHDIGDSIATITLDSPATRNALPMAGWRALADAVAQVAAAGPRAVVLRADGAGMFCSGSDLREIAALALAATPSRERRAEALNQGKAFLLAVAPWFGSAPLPFPEDLPYAVAVGAAAGAFGIPGDDTATAYLQTFAANLISAAVRLVPLGQTTGLHVLAALEPVILHTATETESAALADIGGCAFRSDLAAMRHETQYTRLFRS